MQSTTQFQPNRSIVQLKCGIVGAGLLFLIAASGCGGIDFVGHGIKGSGVVAAEDRPISGYSKIDVSGVAKLEWQPGKVHLRVSAEDNLLPHLKTEVVDGTLKIYFDESVRPTKDVVVEATGVSLDGFTGSGATNSTLKNILSKQFALAVNGASQCTISGQVKTLSAECKGASSLHGDQLEAGSAKVAAQGSAKADLRAKELQSVEASGASHVSVSDVNGESVKLDIDGASRCTISGQVKSLKVRATGASNVYADKLKAESVDVDISGSSRLEAAASQRISGSASGAASVHFHGTPETHVETSGAASVKGS
jgi:hypothetical protein